MYEAPVPASLKKRIVGVIESEAPQGSLSAPSTPYCTYSTTDVLPEAQHTCSRQKGKI